MGLGAWRLWSLGSAQSREAAQIEQIARRLAVGQVVASVDFTLQPKTQSLGGESSHNPRHEIPAGTDSVVLRLENSGKADAYLVEVRGDRGESVWSGMGSASGGTVTAEIPAKYFQYADYSVILSGRTADGDFRKITEYSFRVTK
jgi:hypothetical protein